MRSRRGQRLFDLLLASALLVVCLPLLVLAALIIRLNSPGPLLYRARRSGLNGVVFEMFKFRSMTQGADEGDRISAVNDSRVFPGGSFLRIAKLDELPQLVNILRGEMSFVGPRPEDPGIVAEHYGPAERKTLSVRPGLTSRGSLWYYTEGADLLKEADSTAIYAEVMRRKLAIDAAYAKHATLVSDVVLILKTGLIVLGQLGAALRRRIASPRRRVAD